MQSNIILLGFKSPDHHQGKTLIIWLFNEHNSPKHNSLCQMLTVHHSGKRLVVALFWLFVCLIVWLFYCFFVCFDCFQQFPNMRTHTRNATLYIHTVWRHTNRLKDKQNCDDTLTDVGHTHGLTDTLTTNSRGTHTKPGRHTHCLHQLLQNVTRVPARLPCVSAACRLCSAEPTECYETYCQAVTEGLPGYQDQDLHSPCRQGWINYIKGQTFPKCYFLKA